MYSINDSNPNSFNSHVIEAKEGWSTCGRLILSKKDDEWLIESLFTKSEHRGRGLGNLLVEHVENKYGSVVIESEADGFWLKQGYAQCPDGLWRKK